MVANLNLPESPRQFFKRELPERAIASLTRAWASCLPIGVEIEKSPFYEGKAKRLFRAANNLVLQEFKNSATAFNGQKKAEIKGKAEINAAMSAMIFQHLEEAGIKTHLVDFIPPRSHLIQPLKMILLEVVVRNFAAGSYVKRTTVKEGEKLTPPALEFFYKDDSLGDPMMAEAEILAKKIADTDDLEALKQQTIKINAVLSQMFSGVGLQLVDFKLEFGKTQEGEIILADEISPDTCRLWNQESGEKLDKDRFRFDLGNLMDGYQEIFSRLKTVIKWKERH